MTRELMDECSDIDVIMTLYQTHIEENLLPKIYETKGEDMTEEMIDLRESLKYWLDNYKR